MARGMRSASMCSIRSPTTRCRAWWRLLRRGRRLSLRLAESPTRSAGRWERMPARLRRVRDVPLEQEGTQDLDALHDYALGEAAMQRGRMGDAIAAYRRAVVRAPRFTQAQMRLAWLYGAEKAEVASASAAGLALEGAKGAGEKLRMLGELLLSDQRERRLWEGDRDDSAVCPSVSARCRRDGGAGAGVSRAGESGGGVAGRATGIRRRPV